MNENILTRNNPFKQTTSTTGSSANNFLSKYINWDNYQLPLIFLFSLLSLNYFNMKLLKYVVQYFLDKSVISIKSTKVSDPTERSIRMLCESTVSSSSPLSSTVFFEGPVQLGFINLEGEAVWFGESEMPSLNMKAGGPMELELPLHVIFKDTKKFGEFNKLLMLRKSLKMIMKGFVTVRMLGFLKVRGAVMNKTIEIKGMDGLNQVSIKDVVVKKGDRSKVEIAVSCKMNNVSDISMALDQVWFNMYYKETQVGTVSITPLSLVPGVNSPPTRVFFHPDPNNPKAIEMGRELMSNFTKGADSETTIKGNHPNKQLPSYFAEGLSGLSITTTLNGLDIPLVKSAKMSISPLDLVVSMAAFSVPTRLMTTNPFDEDFYIIKINSEAIIKGVNIGTLNADHSSYPIKIARRTTVETGLMTMKLNPLVEGFGAVATTLGEGNMTADIKATIDAKVGNYSMVIDYEQKQVPVIVGL